ncbi:Putative receptor-like protein kinase [Morus notabilis]|uniref:non-specific serine/threonine protein kinase n=1 Tax=Morus notabilis TaxID=981085 RepID=W9RHK6_9ROSA|nr:putative receptor-like protein kinase At1g80870 [Morus notabilis]EXB55137.1 Putative receptor-like protein kinase [Morus notabilis]
MPSRPFPANPSSLTPRPPSFLTKTRVLFLALTISASLVILASIIYFLYHLWHSLVHRAKTIPFDSSAPLKLQRFSYKELKNASNDFDASNVIGKGGSGTVFRGILRSGKLIAIKRLDALSLQTEREFQNELQILGGLRSPFLVTLLGYCVEKNNRILVYEYMPNKSLQESLFGDGVSSLSWERRFEVILDVTRALEFLHLGCDPPVIHGDIKPSNVLLDFDYRAKISDFGLSRIKVEGEFGVDMFSQDLGKSQELWKSQELSGNLTAETPTVSTPVESSAHEVDFALALQASSSSKNSRSCYYNAKALNLNSVNYNANIATESDVIRSGGNNAKGKEVSIVDFGGDGWNHKFVPYDDEPPCSIDHSKELNSNNTSSPVDEALDAKQWGKDWWWRQDGSGELCSKDYVMEWIGSQICPSTNPDWDEGKKTIQEKVEGEEHSTALDELEEGNEPHLQGFGFKHSDKVFEKKESRWRRNCKKKPRKMQEWWREEHLAEISKKKGSSSSSKLKSLETKWKKGFKIPHFDLGRRFYFRRRKNFAEQSQNECDENGEFSFRRGWKKNKNNHSVGSDMWSGDLFSRELSSTTSMRGTLCYVAPEYGGCGYLMEKADIYSLGVLILVIVSGRRPLHVLASPMKLEKANLISWCRQLAQAGNVLELVDEKLKDEYNKDQASLCINLAITCLQKMPELRPDIGEIVRILRGEMDLPPLPFEFSPSPPSKLYSRSRRKHKVTD